FGPKSADVDVFSLRGAEGPRVREPGESRASEDEERGSVLDYDVPEGSDLALDRAEGGEEMGREEGQGRDGRRRRRRRGEGRGGGGSLVRVALRRSTRPILNRPARKLILIWTATRRWNWSRRSRLNAARQRMSPKVVCGANVKRRPRAIRQAANGSRGN